MNVGLLQDINQAVNDYHMGILTKGGLAAQFRSIMMRIRNTEMEHYEADELIYTIDLFIAEIGLENV